MLELIAFLLGKHLWICISWRKRIQQKVTGEIVTTRSSAFNLCLCLSNQDNKQCFVTASLPVWPSIERGGFRYQEKVQVLLLILQAAFVQRSAGSSLARHSLNSLVPPTSSLLDLQALDSGLVPKAGPTRVGAFAEHLSSSHLCSFGGFLGATQTSAFPTLQKQRNALKALRKPTRQLIWFKPIFKFYETHFQG